MRAILFASLFSLLLLGAAIAAEVSRAEVAADCHAEGKAMGVPEKDLNDYVKDCIAEFIGSKMVNNQSRDKNK
jgi:hypothetical protein